MGWLAWCRRRVFVSCVLADLLILLRLCRAVGSLPGHNGIPCDGVPLDGVPPPPQLLPRVGKAVETHVNSSSGGWVIPFVLLLVGIIGIGAFGYVKYRHLVKSHLL